VENDPHAVVVFVESRHLRDAHMTPPAGAQPLSLAHIFHVVASLFLKPGANPGKLSPAEQAETRETATALEQAWHAQRAIVLLDALDEAPTPELRQWLAKASNVLMPGLRTNVPPDKSDQLPAGRCYLTLRAAELERQNAISLTGAPIFLVNALDMEQIRAIARRRLGENSALYARFDVLLPHRLDIQKIAGTPLTAMLMVFFYEVFQRFARRFATYQLLVLFVLDRAWWRIKTDTFGAVRQGLNPFFHEILRAGFLEARRGLELQYHGLAYVARRVLYHRRAEAPGESERAISRVELVALLHDWLDQQRGQIPSDAGIGLWLEAWERENILLPSGPNHFVFLHSTVLEFLAAVDLAGALQTGDDLQHVIGNRSRDHQVKSFGKT